MAIFQVCAVCEGFGTLRHRDFAQCHGCDGQGFVATGAKRQSRGMSFAEICFSTAIGFVIAFITNAVVMPAFGHHVSASQNFWITVIFTVVSIIRGYFVRRLFEAMHR